jgi:hypothetical protein
MRLRDNWKLFLGIAAVYLVLSLVLVKGFSISADSLDLKTILNGDAKSLTGGLLVFTLLTVNAGSSSTQVAGLYQTFLILIMSLAVIWALRHVFNSPVQVRVRDAFYQGMYPLIPVLLVILTIGLQLLPMVIGAALYSIVVSQGIAAHPIEEILFAVLGLLLTAWSFRMIISSIFAVYIAALPDMTPMKALRSAKDLVRTRRWTILRKLLFLPFCLLLIALLIMLPVIMLVTPLAQWTFFVLTIAALPAVHAYLYTLYRELLK